MIRPQPVPADRQPSGPRRAAFDHVWSGPLIPLLIAATIPVLLFGGWTAYSAADEQRTSALRTARETVGRVAERVMAEAVDQVRVAETLAASTALDGPDLPAFYREAERVAAAHPLWHTVELDDPTGDQILNLLRPPGLPLGPTADRATFDEVFRTHEPAIGGIGPVGPVSGLRLVALRVPVMRNGTLRNVLTIAFEPDAVGDILQQAGIPEGWIGAVVDRSGNYIARTHDDAATLGLPASASVRRAIRTSRGGFYEGVTRDGVAVETVFAPLPAAGGWSVHLGIPRSALDGPERRALYAVAAAGAASLALAAALIATLSRDIGRRRRRETSRAEAALEASEGRAALAVAAADLGTWRWDVAGDRVTGCERCRNLLNLPLSPTGDAVWPSKAFLDAVHPDDRAALKSAAKGGHGDGWKLRDRFPHRDGARRPPVVPCPRPPRGGGRKSRCTASSPTSASRSGPKPSAPTCCAGSAPRRRTCSGASLTTSTTKWASM